MTGDGDLFFLKAPVASQDHGGVNRVGQLRLLLRPDGLVVDQLEELASRGFVVLSLSAYGSGSSETQDVGDPRMDPSLGIYDGLQYLRTLQRRCR